MSQVTISQLADLLGQVSGGTKIHVVSGDVMSYRGYYERLALEPGDGIPARALRGALLQAVGETFEGYKGGDYTMTGGTLVHAAEYGSLGRVVTGLALRPDGVHLETVEESY